MGAEVFSIGVKSLEACSLSDFIGECNAYRGVDYVDLYISSHQPELDYVRGIKILYLPFFERYIARSKSGIVRLETAEKFLNDVPYNPKDLKLENPSRIFKSDLLEGIMIYGERCLRYLGQNDFKSNFNLRFKPWDTLEKIMSMSVKEAKMMPEVDEPKAKLLVA
ncbi:MAG: hypothetical protein KKA62_01835 [Nanoarchaeota archaeon]|nr:hypothetical protein [Nanoarchaeota archaeon]MBU1643822.1 hypothetical protein [Nanoarchaeota archaeon]MBU1976674.1 hypothetical protein [Nanoarchaeota archaeon]